MNSSHKSGSSLIAGGGKDSDNSVVLFAIKAQPHTKRPRTSRRRHFNEAGSIYTRIGSPSPEKIHCRPSLCRQNRCHARHDARRYARRNPGLQRFDRRTCAMDTGGGSRTSSSGPAARATPAGRHCGVQPCLRELSLPFRACAEDAHRRPQWNSDCRAGPDAGDEKRERVPVSSRTRKHGDSPSVIRRIAIRFSGLRLLHHACRGMGHVFFQASPRAFQARFRHDKRRDTAPFRTDELLRKGQDHGTNCIDYRRHGRHR